MTEAELDEQMLAMFDGLRGESDEFREEFREGLRNATNWDLCGTRKRLSELNQEHAAVIEQQDGLLNLRLLEAISSDTYAQKATELRDQETRISQETVGLARQRCETADITVKAFELSQSLASKWVKADYTARRRILKILCLNFSLDGVTLVPVMRKPFDMLAKGLGRGDWI